MKRRERTAKRLIKLDASTRSSGQRRREVGRAGERGSENRSAAAGRGSVGRGEDSDRGDAVPAGAQWSIIPEKLAESPKKKMW